MRETSIELTPEQGLRLRQLIQESGGSSSYSRALRNLVGEEKAKRMASQLDHMIRDGRPFSIRMEKEVAEMLAISVSDLRAAVGHEFPKPGDPLHHLKKEEARARELHRQGLYDEAIKAAEYLEAEYAQHGEYIHSAEWSVFKANQFRFTGDYQQAAHTFRHANQHLTRCKESHGTTWAWIRQYCHADMSSTWLDLHVVKADLNAARKKYNEIRHKLTQVPSRLSNGDTLPIDVRIELGFEIAGIDRRQSEINLLQGRYHAALKNYQGIIPDMHKFFEADQGVWSLYGHARSQLMLGNYAEAKEELETLRIIAKRRQLSRQLLYTETALLQWYLAKEQMNEFHSNLKKELNREGQSPRRVYWLKILEAVGLLSDSAASQKLDQVMEFVRSQTEGMRLVREQAVGRLVCAAWMQRRGINRGAHDLAIQAHQAFEQMTCLWGILRCELLIASLTDGKYTPTSRTYEGVDQTLHQKAKTSPVSVEKLLCQFL